MVLFVSNAHALNELTLLADALEQVINLRAAAVNNHRIEADQLEQHTSRAKQSFRFASVMALPPC